MWLGKCNWFFYIGGGKCFLDFLNVILEYLDINFYFVIRDY